jgi:hypothetical protein
MIRLCVIVTLLLTACSLPSAASAAPATVTVTLDLGGGTTGFAATIYAQDVERGTTVTALYPVQSPPITLTLEQPGTYVVYAKLLEAPDEYQYAAVDCVRGEPCEPQELLAYEIAAGQAYEIIIDRRAPALPEVDQPVTVPWRVKE